MCVYVCCVDDLWDSAHQDAVHSNSGAVSLPALDFYLDVEINKAATMLYNFKNTLGEEKIPRELLDIAKGVVFLTIVKVSEVNSPTCTILGWY
jgi:hypothetical protein